VHHGARSVDLDGPRGAARVTARLVVAADGLAGGLLTQASASSPRGTVATGSRVGLGGVVDAAPAEYAAGVIHMAVAAGGYVGLVRQEDGRLNVAAAIDAARLKAPGGPDAAIRAILAGAAFPELPAGAGVVWTGTPTLTRRPERPGAERLLAVGDAAGYVEPFTGEGIAWALAGAVALAPLAAEAAASWHPEHLERWSTARARQSARGERLCRVAAWTLRRPALARAALRAVAWLPGLAAPVVSRAAGAHLHASGAPA
jgi:flavin-dependent dehydrogenase